jgi:hypothetical protein
MIADFLSDLQSRGLRSTRNEMPLAVSANIGGHQETLRLKRPRTWAKLPGRFDHCRFFPEIIAANAQLRLSLQS